MERPVKRQRDLTIPAEVRAVMQKLIAAGFPAYAVGGSVRDILLGRQPTDWDVATGAAPEEIQALFPESFYANKFFTVTVKTGSADETLAEIEVTTFRSEGRYGDKRHPSEVKPAKTIEEDLARRDFTVNAMALMVSEQGTVNSDQNVRLIDPCGGKRDLDAKLIRAVGDPNERFDEDALRMLRAARFAAELGFAIERKTRAAIAAKAGSLRAISKERIRDEFSKVVMADGGDPSGEKPGPEFGMKSDLPGERHAGPESALNRIGASRAPHQIPNQENRGGGDHLAGAPSAAVGSKLALLERIGAGQAWRGMEMLHELGLLEHIVPELEEGIGCTQNKHHVYTVWEHNMRSLDFAATKGWSLAVRIAALFHDIAKPRTKKGEGPDSTFYNHDSVAGWINVATLPRLRYPQDFTEKIARLVRWHLFRYDYEGDAVETTDSSIRRLIRNVGVENIEDLVRVRMCDRIGSGVPKAVPYRLRHFQFRVEKVLREHEAVKVSMLQIRGDDIMRILGIEAGPKVGHVLNALLEEVLDDQKKNDRAYLESRIRELGALSDEELVNLRERVEARVDLLEDQREMAIKQKYRVE